MAGTISESYLSRACQIGGQNGRELVYHIIGTDDDAEAQNLLIAQAPGIYQGLRIDTYDVEPVGKDQWSGRARYLKLDAGNEYTFDTGGGTQKITQSLHTTIYDFEADDPYGDVIHSAPNFNGAIGVSGDSVEGVDITVPVYQFTETHYFAPAMVTDAYKKTLRDLTGTVNNAPFRGDQAGECLFLGATGSQRGDENWSITFRFASSPNETDIDIGGGGLTVDEKAGWDYLWIRYDDFEDTDAFALVKRPVGAYVEQVYKRTDFSLLGIG